MSPIVTNSIVIDSKQTGMKIGLLGGTFDPIHFGHIKPALEVLKQLSLDKVWLMPNHIPPHKQTTQVSSQHRLAMTQLVCQQYQQFEVCDIEINRDTPSYSATTLQLLAEQFPQHQFYFIMGTDSFIQLPSWYQWQSIFDLCNIVVCQRPGWQLDKSSQMAELLAKNAVIPTAAKKGKIFPVDVTLQDISSTEIRQLLNKVAICHSHNESNNASGFESNTAQTSKPTFDSTVAAMLPNVIQQYIYQHHLYQNK